MKHITFYLDFISPYAYLAFDALPKVLLGLNYCVTYQPVLLGALLKHNAMLGPAEVPPKRDWIYRHVQWLAHSQGLEMQMPAKHPFNSLGLLRLALATDPNGKPNRYVCETLLRHVWVGGGDAADAARLARVTQLLTPEWEPAADCVKALLKKHTDNAIAHKVFGVPSFEVDGKVFWGLDALPMLRQYLEGSPWFDGTAWDAVTCVPSGLSRV
jgi:2-hydroxychromene-2-carboxylate isomerase